ncbi:MAG: pirin family protein [Spirobacillus cienkowskii]|jgi:redox-sensitive bicupin YhaK (pirin superfamily)|uniref:Pirin family protein n=1 Tax=Spirobacillus cienkowskii TaxID=495820 RepID=A0A369KYU9_9BACT|nr:MAG: pirin family protein [Spirobacillus cienkowskii]
MKIVRKSSERGSAEFGWLHAKYTFSFGEFYDSKNMGFRKLRVLNEDKVEPSKGFPTHGHKNMEIVTYILSGVLEHKDSMENSAIISAGEVQVMSAGSGVRHSEFNHSDTEIVHLLQIWIESAVINQEPSYQQKSFLHSKEKLTLIVSPNGERESLTIKQDVKIYQGILLENQDFQYKIKTERHAWIQIAKGSLFIDDSLEVFQGDGIAITEGDIIKFSTRGCPT